MRKTLTLIGVAVLATLVAGCGPDQQSLNQTYQATPQNVQVYKLQDTNYSAMVANAVPNGQQVQQVQGQSGTDMSWLYWYVFMTHGNYYYAYSPTPIASSGLSSLSWKTSKTEPEEIQEYQSGKVEGEKEQPEQVENEQLGQQVEAEMAENGYSPQEQASEGDSSGPSTTTEEENEGGGTTESSEGATGESGGGDSGGGDSGGGGDGGGGGGGD